MNIKEQVQHLREQAHRTYVQSSIVNTVTVVDNEPSLLLNEELETLTGLLEQATLDARILTESCYLENQAPQKSSPGVQGAPLDIAGHVEIDDYGWLHIVLNTLLPHAKYKGSPYLKDTILRLLSAYQKNAGSLPFYSTALLVIDEHCNLESRRAFDQDNKAWRAIPNALKGLVIADDDQFSLGITLLSTWDKTPACHIYVIDIAEAGAFFSLHTGDCGAYFR